MLTWNSLLKKFTTNFDNKSTKASAESFNAKIKAFRAQFRGVRNVEFFLFRLTNIYAYIAPQVLELTRLIPD
ncbi:transposase [Flavobacterium limnophilum]|uniref:transposase n=1 Tax=Flavobacterium limnophilum TaxID=3003262 RepID=UPI0022AC242D|nr:transposase [Flavobacterium limnophilum]